MDIKWAGRGSFKLPAPPTGSLSWLMVGSSSHWQNHLPVQIPSREEVKNNFAPKKVENQFVPKRSKICTKKVVTYVTVTVTHPDKLCILPTEWRPECHHDCSSNAEDCPALSPLKESAPVDMFQCMQKEQELDFSNSLTLLLHAVMVNAFLW